MAGEHAFRVRDVQPEDRESWIRMRVALWPDGPLAQHEAEATRFLRGESREPLAVFVAEDGRGNLAGFAEVSIRAHAEGCVTDHVGYLEGWYVDPGFRRQGIGRSLVRTAERWARARGCSEFASDTEADNPASALAHRALGFSDAGLVRCFCKALASEGEDSER